LRRRGRPRLLRLPAVADTLDVDRSTIWRYRRRDWLPVVNVNGKLFVTQTELDQFIRRAKRGDFARRIISPRLTRQPMGAS